MSRPPPDTNPTTRRRVAVAGGPADQQAGPRVRSVPAGDTRERLTCPDCGFIAYENPKVVVGAVIYEQGRILMCRRAIEPRKGYWTIPAGFLELNETTAEGAVREAWEEACARITIDALLAVYNIPRISQVQLIYRATLSEPSFAAGEESLEVALFEPDLVPTDQLAFPSVHWALAHAAEVADLSDFTPRGNPAGEWGEYRS